jgi:hypothetical protein
MDSNQKDGRMFVKPQIGLLALIVFFGSTSGVGIAEERTERFDRDPGWDGHNSRSTVAARVCGRR